MLSDKSMFIHQEVPVVSQDSRMKELKRLERLESAMMDEGPAVW